MLAIAMAISAHHLSIFPGDLQLSLLLQSIQSDTLTEFMKGLSFITGSWRVAPLVIIAGILMLWRVGKWEALLIVMAGMSSFSDSIFKIAVDRPRPTADLVTVYANETDRSFPSGHAFFAAIFLGLVAYLAFTRFRDRNLRILTLSSILALILLIGASRVYLGAHWASDVLGGYLFGTVFLIVFIWLDRVWNCRLQSSNARTLKET